MPKKPRSIAVPDSDRQGVFNQVELQLDAPGLLFVEARNRIQRGSSKLERLQRELEKQRSRLSKASSQTDELAHESAWVDVIQGIGSLEPVYGATIRELIVADILLVTAAEAYINEVAHHRLDRADAELFDKLSPLGKWLFLPKLLKLTWRPSLSRGPLQQFAALVARRNKFIHPKVFQVTGVAAIEEFLRILQLNANSAAQGVAAVGELIRSISKALRGSSGPDWLNESSAKKQPPCFVIGNPTSGYARLGRLNSRRKRAGV